ncbi:probable U3 small nucleolar RNA-associated protein 11 isoform X3 [Diaphorina citri]|jgi:Uncharacterized conserved protein|uniref:U3 small nucleolar RNA-associated protein 11 n=1 Tax=Diaphorina citri TaxID=121845 RepID=A0A1S3D5U0_DIACI|nr:probable U3 small nucleolar RNA-associated protein 11 isoform X2 [Diaphorina citri]XP_026680817.1 probable U3 small nucleolar RNA-associated protein 11 isoform X3 [Diaphorina citri]KAI5701859.1 hypothetical protein M8J75_014144 [Diaphorina citri]KAI5730119.1 hypothetical protein M8J76_010282 [Diaphorina citri]KAI5734747.1 hypothetical protein M8J77_010084 [Diaphorina citri]
MSSWVKAAKVNQKTHRERHQPEDRRKLGLLEKKKDYRVRADHFNKKKKTLQILKKKALEKNEDEFHTHMINARLVDGEHFENPKPEAEDSEEQKLLMDTQDAKYVSSRRVMEKRKIEKIKAGNHMIDAANQIENTHVFFVDNEAEAKKFDVVKQLKTLPELLPRKTNRLKVEDIAEMSVAQHVKSKMKLVKARQAEKLGKRLERERNLGVVERKLFVQRFLSEKPKLVKPGTPDSAPVYKWKFERKK